MYKQRSSTSCPSHSGICSSSTAQQTLYANDSTVASLPAVAVAVQVEVGDGLLLVDCGVAMLVGVWSAATWPVEVVDGVLLVGSVGGCKYGSQVTTWLYCHCAAASTQSCGEVVCNVCTYEAMQLTS